MTSAAAATATYTARHQITRRRWLNWVDLIIIRSDENRRDMMMTTTIRWWTIGPEIIIKNKRRWWWWMSEHICDDYDGGECVCVCVMMMRSTFNYCKITCTYVPAADDDASGTPPSGGDYFRGGGCGWDLGSGDGAGLLVLLLLLLLVVVVVVVLYKAFVFSYIL